MAIDILYQPNNVQLGARENVKDYTAIGVVLADT